MRFILGAGVLRGGPPSPGLATVRSGSGASGFSDSSDAQRFPYFRARVSLPAGEEGSGRADRPSSSQKSRCTTIAAVVGCTGVPV